MAKSLTPSERKALEAHSPVAWMLYNNMVNNKGKQMEWENHAWMIDILADQNPELVVEKGAQIGMSTCEIFKVLHKAVHDKITAIYILPTRDDVREFVPLKVDPIIQLNNIPTVKKDSIEQKVIGIGKDKSFLLWKGSWKEHDAIMVDGDALIYDEYDKCDEDVLTTYESRVQASDLKWMHRFSTPTAPNKLIDKWFARSDQKHWFIKCGKCEKEQYLDWPDSICYERRIYQCRHCGAEITDQMRRIGRWIRKWTEPPRSNISGYWVSQMMYPPITADHLIQVEEDKNRQYLMNFCLGKPYIGSEISVSEGVIFKNLRDSGNHKRDACMGVDVRGSEHHVVVGNQEGIFELAVIQYTRDDPFKGFDRIAGKLTEYDVRTCVIDGAPLTNEARKLANDFPWRVFLNFYKPQDLALEPFTFDDVSRNVISDRHRTISDMIQGFYFGRVGIYVNPETREFHEYIKHWSNIYLKTETDKLGQEKQSWSNAGPDHFVHATNYYRMALERTARTSTRIPVKQGETNQSSLMLQKAFAKVGTESKGDWYNDY